jgi:hypothetical protein
VISKRVLWTIVIGLAAVIVVTMRIEALPAHVVIINQSGAALTNVVVATDRRIELGSISNGETRRLSVEPAESVNLIFHTAELHTWHWPQPIVAGQSLVLYVIQGDKVVARNRIGTMSR